MYGVQPKTAKMILQRFNKTFFAMVLAQWPLPCYDMNVKIC